MQCRHLLGSLLVCLRNFCKFLWIENMGSACCIRMLRDTGAIDSLASFHVGIRIRIMLPGS